MDREIGLGTRLRRLTAMLDGSVQQLYDEMAPGFRPRFYPIVQQLGAGAASIGDLATAAGVSQPAITQTVAEMKRLGLVDVSPGRDGRTKLVSLARFGRERVQQLQPLWSDIAAAARRLDEEVPGGLVRALDAALQALERQPFDGRIVAAAGEREVA